MQIGLLVDELLPFKEIQDGRHNYSFSQLAPQQLTNVIYSKNKKTLSALLKHFEKKIKIGLFLRELWPLQ